MDVTKNTRLNSILFNKKKLEQNKLESVTQSVSVISTRRSGNFLLRDSI